MSAATFATSGPLMLAHQQANIHHLQHWCVIDCGSGANTHTSEQQTNTKKLSLLQRHRDPGLGHPTITILPVPVLGLACKHTRIAHTLARLSLLLLPKPEPTVAATNAQGVELVEGDGTESKGLVQGERYKLERRVMQGRYGEAHRPYNSMTVCLFYSLPLLAPGLKVLNTQKPAEIYDKPVDWICTRGTFLLIAFGHLGIKGRGDAKVTATEMKAAGRVARVEWWAAKATAGAEKQTYMGPHKTAAGLRTILNPGIYIFPKLLG
ncbi:hypothetical protein EDB85DRAFT_1896643 [Lactarius pseudohatsudake]|nr:hypothetical protein EDB85DRAFT_1896643 [Lactarius pseudohatsudake]